MWFVFGERSQKQTTPLFVEKMSEFVEFKTKLKGKP